MSTRKPLPNVCGSLSLHSFRTESVIPPLQPISDVYARIHAGDRLILVDKHLVWANDKVKVDQDHLIYLASCSDLDIMSSILT